MVTCYLSGKLLTQTRHFLVSVNQIQFAHSLCVSESKKERMRWMVED